MYTVFKSNLEKYIYFRYFNGAVYKYTCIRCLHFVFYHKSCISLHVETKYILPLPFRAWVAQ